MDEEQNNQQEQQKNSMENKLKNQAKDIGRNVAKMGAKKMANVIVTTIVSAFSALTPFMIIIIVVSLVVSLFFPVTKWVVDNFTSDSTSQKASSMVEEYCTIDEDGIHFNKEGMLKAIEEELQTGGIDLNDLGFGSMDTSNGTSQAAQYLYNFMTASLISEFPYIEGSDEEAKGLIKIKRMEAGKTTNQITPPSSSGGSSNTVNPDQLNTIIGNLQAYISEIKNKYGKKIYVQKIFPVGSDFGMNNNSGDWVSAEDINPKVDKLNDLLQQYCSKTADVEFIDTVVGLGSDGTLSDTDDGLHLNPTATNTWADNIESKVGDLGNCFFIGDSFTVRLIGSTAGDGGNPDGYDFVAKNKGATGLAAGSATAAYSTSWATDRGKQLHDAFVNDNSNNKDVVVFLLGINDIIQGGEVGDSIYEEESDQSQSVMQPTTVVTTTNPTLTELTYIGYEKFQEMLTSTNRATKEESKKYFTLDEAWNLCVSKAQIVTVNGQETDYSMTEVKIPYRTMVSQYTLPFEFLINLQSIAQSANYTQAVADLVRDNSDIELTIFDSITVNTDVYTYRHSTMSKSIQEREVTTIEAGPNGYPVTTTQKISQVVRSGPNKQPDQVTTTVTTTDKLVANVTKAKTWILDQTTNYECVAKSPEYPLGQQGQTVQLPDEAEPSGDEGTWKVDQSETTVITVNENEWQSEGTKAQLSPSLFLGLWKNDTGKYVKGAPFNKDGIEVQYKLPQGTYENDNPRINIFGAEEWFCTLLENNQKTQVHAELMRYLINLYKNGGVDDGSINILISIFDPTEFVEGSYQGDFDVHDVSLFITDINLLKQAFSGGYSGSDKLVQYAQAFLDMQDKYQVNAIFAAAVSITETSAGHKGNAVNGKHNWFNISDGKGGYRTFGSDQEGIQAFGELIANGTYYYKQGRYTVGTIGPTYCPNTIDYPTQADEWVADTKARIAEFYSAAGMDTGYIGNTSPSYTGGKDLNSLFPNGIPKTEGEMKQYLTNISISVNNKQGKKVTRSLTVHKAVADDVRDIFAQIQASGFKAYDVGAYSWRSAAASSSRSHHSYGVAIDINPNENYMIKNGQIVAGKFWKPGTNEYSITPNGPVVKAFTSKGWTWGGTWSSSKDYMHFSLTGR